MSKFVVIALFITFLESPSTVTQELPGPGYPKHFEECSEGKSEVVGQEAEREGGGFDHVHICDVLKIVPTKYFFSNPYYTDCALCIAVALRIEMEFEKALRRGGLKWPSNNILGTNFCDTSFLKYDIRLVGDIMFIGDETISSTRIIEPMNLKIPGMLRDECLRMVRHAGEPLLFEKWATRSHNLIEALCRSEECDERIWASCTRAKIKYNPSGLHVVRSEPNTFQEKVIDYFFNKHISKKLNEELEILKAWAQYWN